MYNSIVSEDPFLILFCPDNYKNLFPIGLLQVK